MDPLTMAVGTALVSVMTTDAWKQAKDAFVALWRKVHPERANAVAAELDVLRPQVLAARQNDDTETEAALAGQWRLRVQELLTESPDLAENLRRLLQEQLLPALDSTDQEHVQSIVIKTEMHDQSRAYISARDMHITDHGDS